jgi:hypothetical protein
MDDRSPWRVVVVAERSRGPTVSSDLQVTKALITEDVPAGWGRRTGPVTSRVRLPSGLIEAGTALSGGLGRSGGDVEGQVKV